jgi:uncharacterized protein (TIGR03083 family)
MNKTEFITTLRAQRERLEAALAGLSEAQITRPGANGQWSVKDLVAHLTYWERGMVDILEQIARGEPIQDDETGTTDAINVRVYARNRERSLADVLADFRESYRRLLGALQALPDETLNGPSPFEPPDGKRLWEYIAGESFRHYKEHIDQIHA